MTNKLKIFLDNNIFDKLIELPIKELNVLKQKCVMYTCDTILKELNEFREKEAEKRPKIDILLEGIQIVKTAFFGFCTYNNPHPENIGGFATGNALSPGGTFYSTKEHIYRQKIKAFLDKFGKKKPRGKTNENDVKIATLAYAWGATLITQDGVTKDFPNVKNGKKGLYQAVKENQQKVMNINELLRYCGISLVI